MRCSHPTSGSPERAPGRVGALTARRPGPGLEWGVKESPNRAGWPAVGMRSGPSGPGCGLGQGGGRLGSPSSTRTQAGAWGHRVEVGGPSAHASVLALPFAVVCFCDLALCSVSPLQGELPEDRNPAFSFYVSPTGPASSGLKCLLYE